MDGRRGKGVDTSADHDNQAGELRLGVMGTNQISIGDSGMVDFKNLSYNVEGGISATGYVEMKIGGVTYRFLVSTVP